jgi:hypothetical protein
MNQITIFRSIILTQAGLAQATYRYCKSTPPYLDDVRERCILHHKAKGAWDGIAFHRSRQRGRVNLMSHHVLVPRL